MNRYNPILLSLTLLAGCTTSPISWVEPMSDPANPEAPHIPWKEPPDTLALKQIELPADLETLGSAIPHQHTALAVQLDFVCPMHLEIQSTKKAARCTRCGMNLEPNPKAARFVCPMHPKITSVGPARCAKCGMKLEAAKTTGKEGRDKK